MVVEVLVLVLDAERQYAEALRDANLPALFSFRRAAEAGAKLGRRWLARELLAAKGRGELDQALALLFAQIE